MLQAGTVVDKRIRSRPVGTEALANVDLTGHRSSGANPSWQVLALSGVNRGMPTISREGTLERDFPSRPLHPAAQALLVRALETFRSPSHEDEASACPLCGGTMPTRLSTRAVEPTTPDSRTYHSNPRNARPTAGR